MKQTEICPVCKGTGKEVFKHIDHKTGEMVEELVRCGYCEGCGYTVVRTCSIGRHMGFGLSDHIGLGGWDDDDF